MNRAAIYKTARDSRLLVSGVLVGIVLLETLFVLVIGEFAGEMEYLWLQKAFFQRFARTILGADLGSELSATGLMCIGFAHPLLYAMTWMLLLTACTAVIVGEIERGTADVLMTLPLSRTRLYCSVSTVWIAAGVPVVLAALLGAWLGQRIRPLWEDVDFGALWKLGANFLMLYWCIGAAAMCVSSFSSRRGAAVAAMLVWLLSSVLLNFLAQFSVLFERLSMVGLLHYYRPLPIIRDGRWAVRDMAILFGLAVGLWLVGLWRFGRRDIPAA